jgi:hypothetical protein
MHTLENTHLFIHRYDFDFNKKRKLDSYFEFPMAFDASPFTGTGVNSNSNAGV